MNLVRQHETTLREVDEGAVDTLIPGIRLDRIETLSSLLEAGAGSGFCMIGVDNISVLTNGRSLPARQE